LKLLDFSPEGRAAHRRLNPFGKIPVLVDGGRVLPESSIIIEHLERRHPASGPQLIPKDPELALEVRLWDRQLDCYLNDALLKVFFDKKKPEILRDPDGVAKAEGHVAAMFAKLDAHLAGKTWLVGEAFTLADCAAAPPLGYFQMNRALDPHP